jgi:diphthamide synthase subunit DPH2
VVSSDNDAVVLEKGTVYVQNFKVARTPQRAAAIHLSYRPGSFFATISAHYMDKRWMSFNPIRRTYNALATLDTASALRTEITAQTQLPAMFTLGALIGQSFRWYATKSKSAHTVMYTISVNNVLQSGPVIMGGYEQLRFDVAGLDIKKFPPKYFLGYGFNFSATISYSF